MMGQLPAGCWGYSGEQDKHLHLKYLQSSGEQTINRKRKAN